MIYCKKIKANNINDEYNSFEERDRFKNFEERKFWDQHERYGYHYMINVLKYSELISNEGDIHGFDGILSYKGKVYFYEAKYGKNKRYSVLFNEAIKTILEPNSTRISNLKNAQKNIESFKKSEGLKALNYEAELIGEYLGCIRDQKNKMSIPEKRMLFALGNEIHEEKTTKKTNEKLMGIKEALVIKYE